MKNSDVFIWNKDFETDISNIDQEHKKLVEIINTISKKLSELDTVFEDMQPIFKELFDYTNYHFKNEEQIMKNVNVDVRHVKEHIAAHRNFIKEITLQYNKIDQDNVKNTAKHLLDFLVQWLTFHILGMDKNLTTQIKFIESGDTPEEAFNAINGVNYGQLDTLVKSFNGVFAVLIKSNEELLTLKKSLEEKVEERTKELKDSNIKLTEAYKKLETIALTDQLTGLGNRHKTMAELDRYMSKFLNFNEIFSVIMFDVDSFKTINDTYGHDAGDNVLIELSNSLQKTIRKNDIACRVGGDEFLVICPKTDEKSVERLAKRIHEAISKLKITFDSNACWLGSVSIGTATCNEKVNTKEHMLKIADNNLYITKKNKKKSTI
ncbi:GGDEF domain-containing protein [Campylobacter sp. faydin G-24]|uniref:diguanylate cyclase n=1 Tax=Campylobacter anatolicus TaxID=2829105 RepID=A0ABS5HJH7_9BACT|nr:GGDEF domain-containing protein [Campylobacter anatolicus]MBR8464165.1 GGDEF domain-containing protein [Campylobacter anatolicus]MBR8466070.1 GGDEF domain-containing protein [Campylobacter anatolicus]